MACVSSPPHFVVFPFMSQGHTIPLLYLARLLHQHHVSVTIFTTPANSPAVRASLHDTQDISVIDLPFPNHITAGIPPGVESTDKLPSMSSFLPFVTATKLIQPHFEQALKNLRPPATCIISDGFLIWTQESASKLGIPRLVSYGFNNFSLTMVNIMLRERPYAGIISLDEPFLVPNFPSLKLTRNDFEQPFTDLEPTGPHFEFIADQMTAMAKSHGLVVNSFYELEPSYVDYWNQHIGPKAWCVGPLCLAKPRNSEALEKKPVWIQWLDEKLTAGRRVLYVAFGSQAEISPEQIREIAMGLEESKVSFLWVLRSKDVVNGFEERVKDRGMIVKEWVDQMEILGHGSVYGFMSHCGWNSVMESVCAGVPILALPLMAEQHVNARMVAEEIGVGLRIWPCNGSVRGFVKSEEVEKMVREIMEGEKGEEVRKKMKEVGEAARGAMEEGGSSRCTLDRLIDEVHGKVPMD